MVHLQNPLLEIQRLVQAIRDLEVLRFFLECLLDNLYPLWSLKVLRFSSIKYFMRWIMQETVRMPEYPHGSLLLGWDGWDNESDRRDAYRMIDTIDATRLSQTTGSTTHDYRYKQRSICHSVGDTSIPWLLDS